MNIKPPQFQIPEENPYENDLLSRQQQISVLSRFITGLTQPFTLAIDGPWGTGKTVFLTMMTKDFRARGVPAIYISAWETDFARDPLLAVLGEADAELTRFASADKDDARLRPLIEAVKNLGARVAKRVLPVSLKLLTAGLLKEDDFTEQALGEFVESTARERLKDYADAKSTIASFKKSLADIVAVLKKGKSPLPLVFIVDELDRCRPSYALEMMETIKHLFGVEGCVFVLGIDQKQMCASVQSLYGSQFDARTYFRKFVDFTYQIPNGHSTAFIVSLLVKFGIAQRYENHGGVATGPAYDLLVRMSNALLSDVSMSLRDQEQCMGVLALALASYNGPGDGYVVLTLTLAVLRHLNAELYERFVSGGATPEDVREFFVSRSRGEGFWSSRYGILTLAWLITAKDTVEVVEGRIGVLKNTLNSPQAADGDRNYSREMIKYIEHLSRHRDEDGTDLLQSVSKRLGLIP